MVKSAASILQQGHTDRQTQVSDTGTHRQTAHAKGPSHSPSNIREENTHICMNVCMYVCMNACMFVSTCIYVSILY